jgi:hypothetical protein
MTRSNSRTSCKPLFWSLAILTLPSQCILSLMKLLLQNMANYTCNFTVQGINTINKLQLYKLASNFTLYQRGVLKFSITYLVSLQILYQIKSLLYWP